MLLGLDELAAVRAHILEGAELALEVLHDDPSTTDDAGEKIVVALYERCEPGEDP
jgi:hypothetical protein